MARKRTYFSKASRLGERILAEIAGGGYAAGAWLPPETQLCGTYRASRVTIRRTLDLLAERGLVERIPHRGVMVKSGPAGQLRTDPPPSASAARRARRRLAFASVLAARPDEGLVNIQEGIDEYVREHGLALRFASDEGGKLSEALARVGELGVDGLILLPYPGAEHFETLKGLGRRLPAVCIERRSPRVSLPSVEPDSAGGMYRAVNYLIQKYRRPVYFLGMRCDHQTDVDRLQGYTCAMRDAGFTELVRSHTVLHELGSSDPAYWREERKWFHGYEAAKRLLARAERPLSVACVKDYTAWGLYRAAEELGWAVGRDVRVTGFDDLTIAQMLTPALTTVHQSMREKGYQAAQLLHRRIEQGGDGPAVTVKLPVKLVVRESA